MAFVLVVEDHISSRMGLLFQLEGLGVIADSAANGKEAVERFQSADYKLVLMDLQLPDLNGIEATGMMRAFEKKKGLRPAAIVAVTGSTIGLRDLLDAGLDDCLRKPPRTQALKDILNKWVLGS